MIEKAKQVDVALIVQLLQDAFANHFDACEVYTSDIDYLPALKAVAQRAKRVTICGYENGIGGGGSDFHEAGQFVDLTDRMRTEFRKK
ncbi:MAG: NYN domain-containing protein [Pirellulales bacterium]